MPGHDKTGPNGEGPQTGGGFGYCRDKSSGNFGRGFRRCRGRGFGRRFLLNRNLTKEQEKTFLESELKEISFEKEEIEKRLKELKE